LCDILKKINQAKTQQSHHHLTHWTLCYKTFYNHNKLDN